MLTQKSGESELLLLSIPDRQPCIHHPINPISHHCLRRARIPHFPLANSQCSVPLFHHSIIPTFHYSNIPLFQHSITPTFHYSIIPLLRFPFFSYLAGEFWLCLRISHTALCITGSDDACMSVACTTTNSIPDQPAS